MIVQIDIENREQAQRVLQLQRSAYRVEAEYIGTDDIPPLKETLEDLIHCGERFIGYMEGDTLAGAISYKLDKRIVDIHRMVVHPDFFRRGIAKNLLSYVEIMHLFADEMIVSTGAKNSPAVELYLKLGFEKTGESIFGKNLAVAHFKKHMKRDSH